MYQTVINNNDTIKDLLKSGRENFQTLYFDIKQSENSEFNQDLELLNSLIDNNKIKFDYIFINLFTLNSEVI